MSWLHNGVQSKLTYVSPYPIPSIKADAGQDVSMCAAFTTLGWDVQLLHRPGVTRDVFDHYGIARTFVSRPVTRAARIGEGRWGTARDIGGTLSFALRALGRGAEMFYTRDPIVAWVLSGRGVPVVWEAMSFPDRSKRPFARRFLRTATSGFTFAITSALAHDIESEVGSARRIVPLPVGIDLARYRPSPSASSVRHQLGLPSAGFVAVYTGWMRADRGVGVIVRAAALLPSVTFLMVGGREEEVETLSELASSMGADNVRFIGAISPPEVPFYQLAADVLLLPQSGSSRHLRYHVSPAKLFEYMAASRPIIAADLPCIRELVTHRRDAFLVDPESASEWAAAIETVLNDRALADVLVRNSSREVAAFDWLERVKKVLRCSIER